VPTDDRDRKVRLAAFQFLDVDRQPVDALLVEMEGDEHLPGPHRV
jgi:hypothetical protein